VVDFRWHRSTPSPNWHEIPEGERLVVECPLPEEKVAAATGTDTSAGVTTASCSVVADT
jgi:hypothetical protein